LQVNLHKVSQVVIELAPVRLPPRPRPHASALQRRRSRPRLLEDLDPMMMRARAVIMIPLARRQRAS